MAGDEVNGNNVVERDANNRSDVYTSCTNNDSENTHGHIRWCLLDTIACSSTVRSRTGLVDQGIIHDGRGPASPFIVWASVRMWHAASAHLWW